MSDSLFVTQNFLTFFEYSSTNVIFITKQLWRTDNTEMLSKGNK